MLPLTRRAGLRTAAQRKQAVSVNGLSMNQYAGLSFELPEIGVGLRIYALKNGG
jgi:hypothetical protein